MSFLIFIDIARKNAVENYVETVERLLKVC